MILLVLLTNGKWHYEEVEARGCERTAPIVAARLEKKPEVELVRTACVVRYKA